MPSWVLSGRRRRRFQQSLRTWYRRQGRQLRIRSTREPWPVLVSEVMAQQTQIARVDEAWPGFVARFPAAAVMAEASVADVLREWRGLGYNRRAVALHRTARAIVERHDGRVPGNVPALEALPGIGPYTARAVGALAFGLPVAPVDTNVRRVIRRLCGAVDAGPAEVQAIADTLVDRAEPGIWTHALMELGATVCRARRPTCDACPVRRWCASAGLVGETATRVEVAQPFEATTRWLRGRIVARLRDHEDGSWLALPASFGGHGPERIAHAVAALQRDGLVERRADGAVRLPSSLP